MAEQQARLTENISKFRDEWMGGKKVEVADLLAFDQLQRRVTTALEGGVSQAEVSKLYAAPDTFATFRDDIEKGIGPVSRDDRRGTDRRQPADVGKPPRG